MSVANYKIGMISAIFEILIAVWSKYSADLHWLMATVNLGRRL